MVRFDNKGWEKGREVGLSRGWQQGYFDGQCEAVLRKTLEDEHAGILMNLKLVYVTAGIGVPYPALDQAIIDGLNGLVSELVVVNPSDDIAVMVDTIQPDLVLALNGIVLPAEQVKAIREKGFKTAIWFTDDPYYTDWTISIAPHYEYVFTLELNCLAFYRDLGCRHVHYLPFGLDPTIFRPKRVDTSYHTDICFIGTAYWNRVALIDRMASYLSKKNVLILGWWWDRLQNYSLLSTKIRLGEWMSAEETANYYNGAKIVINLHRSTDDDSINRNGLKLPALSVNPRTFEIAGCGTLQLSDERQDMSNYFTPGVEISTYTSSEDLISKLDYYLNNEEARREIALKGLQRTLQHHTYRKRLIQMLTVIFEAR